MSIYNKIKADFIEARKKRHVFEHVLLSTVIGEMDNEASRGKTGDKTVTDEIAIKVLKSFSKNLAEIIKLTEGDYVIDGDPAIEKKIIDSYLPQQMTEDDLRKAIHGAVAFGTTPDMKNLMSYLKDNFAGLYDGKMASTVVKEFV